MKKKMLVVALFLILSGCNQVPSTSTSATTQTPNAVVFPKNLILETALPKPENNVSHSYPEVVHEQYVAGCTRSGAGLASIEAMGNACECAFQALKSKYPYAEYYNAQDSLNRGVMTAFVYDTANMLKSCRDLYTQTHLQQ